MLGFSKVPVFLCHSVHYIELCKRKLFYKRKAVRQRLFVIKIQETGPRKTNDKMNNNKTQYKQDRQCTPNVTLWRVRLIIAAVETTMHSVCVVK